MIDYSYDYKGESFKVPKNKIFEALYSIGEIAPIATIGEVFANNEFMKSVKIFCVLGDYAGQKLDPMEVTQYYLHNKDGSTEICVAIGGLVALLNPPADFQPPESDSVGK